MTGRRLADPELRLLERFLEAVAARDPGLTARLRLGGGSGADRLFLALWTSPARWESPRRSADIALELLRPTRPAAGDEDVPLAEADVLAVLRLPRRDTVDDARVRAELVAVAGALDLPAAEVYSAGPLWILPPAKTGPR